MTKTLRSPGQLALVRELRQARERLGLSQAELAAELGCHQSFVARIESGQRRIDVPEFLILCRVLRADPNKIIGTVGGSIPEDAKI